MTTSALDIQEDRRKIPEGVSLGLYREDGKEHRKPVYKQVSRSLFIQFPFCQVDGNYRLHYTADSKWVISRLGSPVPEIEIFVQVLVVPQPSRPAPPDSGLPFLFDLLMFPCFCQSNSRLPELSTDRWKYPSHKVPESLLNAPNSAVLQSQPLKLPKPHLLPRPLYTKQHSTNSKTWEHQETILRIKDQFLMIF